MNVVCSAVSVALPTVGVAGITGPLASHVDMCERCSVEVEGYGSMYTQLASLNDRHITAPGGFPQRVMASLGPVAIADRDSHRDHLVPVAAAAALATAAAGGAVLFRLYRQRAA
ncbi:MAG: hypothetical protein GWP18_05100 [Proteobacteria bacterium]|nr:hypothetical protein [Pseudomonadota bacterium]